MSTGFNLDVFQEATIELFQREEILDEGAAGTVNAEKFVLRVKDHLCPILVGLGKKKNMVL